MSNCSGCANYKEKDKKDRLLFKFENRKQMIFFISIVKNYSFYDFQILPDLYLKITHKDRSSFDIDDLNYFYGLKDGIVLAIKSLVKNFEEFLR